MILAIESSKNSKTGPISATYVTQESCPRDCAFLKAGCYAETGFVGIHTRKLNNQAKGKWLTPTRIAMREARAIAKLTGYMPMRLHVVGDARTARAAGILAAAVKRWTQPVWTYTHAWRTVARVAWGKVNVLASCEQVGQVKEAWERGYVAALVTAKFKSKKAWKEGEWTMVPCPAQTKSNVTCVTCRLCWKADWLHQSKRVIVFEAHGSGERKVAQTLVQLRLEGMNGK